MGLNDFWFLLIAVLWTGYFFLEGFDFGVGILTRLLARDRTERRVLINIIGPVWDGNEVWLITAAGAMFAAFPVWYATFFSSFYLLLVLALLLLIVRVLAFEYRHKRPEESWQRNWELVLFASSLLLPFLWGMMFANMVRGVPINSQQNFAGSFTDLLNWPALLGGLAFVALCTVHGAVFTALKTVGDIRVRARTFAAKATVVALLLGGALLIWIQAERGTAWTAMALAMAVVGLLGTLAMNAKAREGWAFSFTGVAIASVVAAIFLALAPDLMPSSLNDAWNLTIDNSASGPYTLKVMTWVAVIMMPLVLLYQGWTYWVFRKRIGPQHIPADAH
ncbi:cytochrome bd-I ubiquinol oxidase subunit 2 apoprotein [Streptomyces sp. TLI_55]|uniref:cytochrome d ubiquinol oxidase subunit II n=1 Tax=Streptomyces sp. TLI_55 TaxID=1938861 RepID=UPI000BC9B5EF|nr:cytochrome d ubiquinol oxidase subunit II [Streptomyces sp. TLI_55]SNX66361.1 cytochrome bd-I ubiquinol oxidase subunit 2 apoprotein [Streptomyces sp. TLI_55]